MLVMEWMEKCCLYGLMLMSWRLVIIISIYVVLVWEEKFSLSVLGSKLSNFFVWFCFLFVKNVFDRFVFWGGNVCRFLFKFLLSYLEFVIYSDVECIL